MPAIRVALCITELEVGGAEKAFTELAVRADRQRFRVMAICLGPRPAQPRAALVKRLEACGVPITFLGARSGHQFRFAVRELQRRLAQQQIDLLQSFLFHANIVGRLAARRAAVRRVVCGIRVAEPRRWHRWVDRLTQTMVDRYVCVSQAVADFATSRAGLAAEKLVVIPNGVDLDRYPPDCPADLEAFGIPRSSPVVTFVGRLEPQKGPEWLVRNAPSWLEQLPACHLLLVGDGPQRRRLERIRRRLGIAQRVHLLGWRPDVPEILAASHLVVLPSRWEGMPNVILEAMATGRPVLATDVEGVQELLGPAAKGQTVAWGDSVGFARRVVALLSDPQLAARIGQANRQRAERQFPIGRTVRAYEELWASLARQQEP
ncbi:MAG TPA: glycosyltransferase [Planctomycetaceae bacterium]|nr:glycosyltransferase [Planctomycetaceae bacterium]